MNKDQKLCTLIYLVEEKCFAPCFYLNIVQEMRRHNIFGFYYEYITYFPTKWLLIIWFLSKIGTNKVRYWVLYRFWISSTMHLIFFQLNIWEMIADVVWFLVNRIQSSEIWNMIFVNLFYCFAHIEKIAFWSFFRVNASMLSWQIYFIRIFAFSRFQMNEN